MREQIKNAKIFALHMILYVILICVFFFSIQGCIYSVMLTYHLFTLNVTELKENIPVWMVRHVITTDRFVIHLPTVLKIIEMRWVALINYFQVYITTISVQ